MNQKVESLKTKPFGERVDISVEDGVDYLVNCFLGVKLNTMKPRKNTPAPISWTTWFVQLDDGSYLHFYFEGKEVYNTDKPFCRVVHTEPFVHQEMGGEDISYHSLGFLDDLLDDVECDTGVKLEYDAFGNKV